MDPKKKERGLDLEEFLNPKSSLSSVSTFMHVLWLKKWRILLVWALIALPAAIILAFYDIPKNYSATTYLRFPRVTGGGQATVVRDISMGEAESVVRLFLSQKVLMKTIEDMHLQMQVMSKEVFRKHVIDKIAYGPETIPGRYRFEFLGGRRVRVLIEPWEKRSYSLYADAVADTANAVAIPGGRITFIKPLLEMDRTFNVDMIFDTPDQTLEDFTKRLTVDPLDKGGAAVNYSVTLQDRDPFLVADVLNELTRNFIIAYTGTTANQDEGVLDRLSKSMESARENMSKAQDRLADFYRRNQGRMAPRDGNPYALATAQTQKTQIDNNLDRLTQSLAGRPAVTDSQEDKAMWMNEVLALLSGQGIQRAEALRARINDLEKKKVALSATYNSTHPFIKEVDDEIAGFYDTVGKLAEDTRRLYQTRQAQAGGDIARNLPGGGVDMSLNLEAKRLSDEKDNAAKALDNLQAEYNQARLSAGPNVFQVNVIDAARPPQYVPPTLRTRLMFSAAAVVLAFFPGFLWALLSQILFPKIWNKDDAERKLKVKVMGSLFHIPGAPERRKPSPSQGGLPVDDRLLHHGKYTGPADVEAYRALRVELEHNFDRDPGRQALSLLVTSTHPNEGKSLVAANLAVGFARRGRRTLLIDVDFRHGRQEQIFGYPQQRGLADLLHGGIDPDFARRCHGMLLPTVQPNLALMPRGIFDEAAMEAVYRAPMEYYIQAAMQSFEVVILDAPPVIVTADPVNLSRLAKGVIFVARSGQVTAHEAARALEPFRERDVPLGVVVNGIRRSPSDENYYARYGYYYLTPEVGGKTGGKPGPVEKNAKKENKEKWVES